MTGLPQALRVALDHVQEAVVITSLERRIAYVNAAFTRASGHSSEEALGKRLDELQRTRAVEGNASVIAVRRKDGSEYYVRRERTPVDGAGAALVIEIQRADDARDRLIAEHSKDMITTVDADGVCTYISPSCREVIGYEPSEIIGVRDLQLTHPDDVAARRISLARAVERGSLRGATSVTRVKHKNGSYIWVEANSSVIRDAEGRFIEVQSSSRDVTARVEAEEALARSEENLRVLLEQLPEAVALHRDGIVLYANPQFVRLLEYEDAAHLIGRRVLDFVHPSHHAEVAERMRAENRAFKRSNEYLALTAKGEPIAVQVSTSPILFEGALAVLVVLQDLTERKKLEAQLAVEDRMASLGRLAVAIGHEINNPLSYILASLELMRDRLPTILRESPHPLLATFGESIGMVREGAERVRDIVRDLRTLSSASVGPTVAVDVHRALDLAAATANHEIRLRARLTKDYGDVGMVYGDERRLVQVFVNLLVNAAQATPVGDAVDNEIRLTTRRTGDQVTIEVRDTGSGLADIDAARIFEPFFTTKPDGVGTGLGLSISHQIVTSFGGTMTAERCTPRGTLLRVSLQACAETAVASTRAVEADAAAALPRMRILVIDDEPQLRRVLTMLLSTHDVVVANGGREAMERLDASVRFDVILCDLQMSDGTGADVYERVRAFAPGLERRMIFMTGGAFTARARAFLASCRQPVLEKPFTPSSLVAQIAQLTRSR